MAASSGFGHIFFFQAEDGIRDDLVTGVQTCALPISSRSRDASSDRDVTIVHRIECAPINSRPTHLCHLLPTSNSSLPSPKRKVGEFFRSEERRVGKECRSRWSPYH